MCGVFAYVSFDGKGPNIKRLKAIATVTNRRGPHAFGFAWVDSKGRIKSFKQTGKITDYLALLELAHDAQFLVGHCRYATHGAPDQVANNHPHPADGGWFVHNGVISDYRQIVTDHDLHPVTSCDSEVLGLLIESGEGRLKTRCVEAVQYASGSPLVFLGVWSRPGRLIALRSGNPLSLGVCKGRVYLASLQEELPGNVFQVPDNQGVDFTAAGMKTIKFSRNASGCSGPADDADDADQDPLEWDLDDCPVETEPAAHPTFGKRDLVKYPFPCPPELFPKLLYTLPGDDTVHEIGHEPSNLARAGAEALIRRKHPKAVFLPGDFTADDGRGIPQRIAPKLPTGLIPIPGTAGAPKQPTKPSAPKLKRSRTVWDDERKTFVPRPKQLDGGLGKRNWLWDDGDFSE